MPEPTAVESHSDLSSDAVNDEAPSDIPPSDVSPRAVSVEDDAEARLPKQSLDIDTYQLDLSSFDVDKFPESVEGDSKEVVPSLEAHLNPESDVVRSTDDADDVDLCSDEQPESVKGVDSNEVVPSLEAHLNPESDVIRSTDDADDVDSCSDEQPEMVVSGNSCSESDFDDHAVPDGDLSECSESDFDDHAVPGGDLSECSESDFDDRVVPDGDLSEEESECSDIWDGDYGDDTAIPNDFMNSLAFEMDSRMEEAKVMDMVKMRSMIDILMLLCGLTVLMCSLLLLLDAVLLIEELEASEVKLLKPPVEYSPRDHSANVIGSGAGISIFFAALIGAAFFARNRWVRQYSKGVL